MRVWSYIVISFEKLEQKPFFTTQEADKHGISSRMLAYYVQKGEIERLARGVYCSKKYEPAGHDLKWEDMAIAASNVKGGVICLISALSYYELTDEIMREFWIAVDNDNSKVNFPMCRFIRMRNMQLGVESIKVSGMKVKIFDIERTLIDSFRLLDFETSIKAMKIYLEGKKGKPNINKLNEYITKLRAAKVREYLTALIA